MQTLFKAKTLIDQIRQNFSKAKQGTQTDFRQLSPFRTMKRAQIPQLEQNNHTPTLVEN